jgi:3-methylfumaryl-CoA hydratase
MDFAAWIGRKETATDTLHPRQARLVQATLDQAPALGAGDILPSFRHYLYFNCEIPTPQLKEDGHERPDRFCTPVPLPHRMWAGGRVEIAAPHKLGECVMETLGHPRRDDEERAQRAVVLCDSRS